MNLSMMSIMSVSVKAALLVDSPFQNSVVRDLFDFFPTSRLSRIFAFSGKLRQWGAMFPRPEMSALATYMTDIANPMSWSI